MGSGLKNRWLLLAAAATAAAAWWLMAHGHRPLPGKATLGPSATQYLAPAARVVTAVDNPPEHSIVVEPRFQLLQVGRAEHGVRDLAILRTDGGTPKPYAVGDTVARGVRLIRIQASSVEVDDHGRTQRIGLQPGVDIASGSLKPLGSMQHGADAATALQPQPEPDVIARAPDLPSAHSTSISRAIDRAVDRTGKR